jgi:hypothetical protein
MRGMMANSEIKALMIKLNQVRDNKKNKMDKSLKMAMSCIEKTINDTLPRQTRFK